MPAQHDSSIPASRLQSGPLVKQTVTRKSATTSRAAMTNPYASPPPSDNPYAPLSTPPPPDGSDSFVKQVPIVAILMMIQGGFEFIMGAFWVGMGVFMSQINAFQPRAAEPLPPQFEWMMLAIYAGVGVVVLIFGLVRAYAGFRNYSFRNRILGIVANILGMASIFTCYCSLTSIALGVYALVVLLQPSVVFEFDQRQAGRRLT